MLLLLIFGVILVGASVALVARAIALPRLRAVARVGEIGAYGYPSATSAATERAPKRFAPRLDGLAERIGGAVLPKLKRGDQDELRRLLATSGMFTTTPGRFLGYRVLCAGTALMAWLWLAPSAGVNPVMIVLGAWIMGASGWVLPLTFLRRRAEERLDRIDFELPQLIDSLIVTVEAGVGFAGALRMSARELRGPLADEMNLTLQEQDMGMTTVSALESFSERVETPAIRSFVNSVAQAETLGVSTGEILRTLAVEMRAQRRAKAEERAQKAPIKMLFPLTFCIFPAIMIVLAYPAIQSILEAL